MGFTEATDADFIDILGRSLAVVDFWAPWCGPCKLFGPTFEEVSEAIKGIKFVKVNTDLCQEITQKFNIRSVPTLVIFKGGIEIARFQGMFNKEQFTAKLNKFIS